VASARDVHIYAVQLQLRADTIGTPGALGDRLRRLAAPAGERPSGTEALIVYPAHVGTLLALEALGTRRGRSLRGALAALGLRRLSGLVASAARFRVREPRAALWLALSVELHGRYQELFSALAREYGAWIVAGSVALPRNGFGPDAPHFWPAAPSVHETSYTFDPEGRNRLEAVRTRPDPDDPLAVGLTGQMEGQGMAETPFGGLATVWGQDGLLTTSRLASAGASVLCQPDAGWRGVARMPALADLIGQMPRIAVAATASLRGDLFEHPLDGPTRVAVRRPDGSVSCAAARPAAGGDAVAHAVAPLSA
jgi:hypothetical protein